MNSRFSIARLVFMVTLATSLSATYAVAQSSVTTTVCPTLYRSVSVGSKGSDIVALQKFLIAQRFLPPDSVTGYFGILTQKGVQSFQRATGIVFYGTPASTGYGAVGRMTRLKIAATCANSSVHVDTPPTSIITTIPSVVTTPLITTTSSPASTILPVSTPGVNVFDACLPDKSSPQVQKLSCSVGQSGEIVQARTSSCPGPTWSTWTTTSNTCTTPAPVSCTQNGVTIASGVSKTFYADASVLFGQSCAAQSQSRTCTDGVLSGSATYGFASCVVGDPNACTFNSQIVSHGNSVTAYLSAAVPYGQVCASQVRLCSNGTLSGTYQFAQCTADTAPLCTALAPQSQTLSCPSGQTGLITQTRTSSCPGPTWSTWTTTSNTCTTPAPVPVAPTASITANGSSNITVTVGDTITYAWSSSGATSVKSMFTEDASSCGLVGTGPFDWSTGFGDSLSGTNSAAVAACLGGHTYVTTYTATNARGQSTSASVTVHVNAPITQCSIPAQYTTTQRQIPMPTFPSAITAVQQQSYTVAKNNLYVSMYPSLYGAAIISVKKADGFEYILNDVPYGSGSLRRGASLQGTFFFENTNLMDAQADAALIARTLPYECNNPLETGSVADLSFQYGLTSPSAIELTTPSIIKSTAQLAYYVDPKLCSAGQAYVFNPSAINAGLSDNYLGKTIVVGNIGTESNPLYVDNVFVNDSVLVTSAVHTFTQQDILVDSYPESPTGLHYYYTYDPRTPNIGPQSVIFLDKDHPVAGLVNWSSLPTIIASADGQHAMAAYSPQIPLDGEGSGIGFYTRQNWLQQHLGEWEVAIRNPLLSAGAHKYKVYVAVGTLTEVKTALDNIYRYMKVLDPRVFNWQYYNTTNNLNLTEDQARLHWITTGITQGLKASANFDVKQYLASNACLSTAVGTNYYDAILYYLNNQ